MVELAAIIDPGRASGVYNGDVLLDFAYAILDADLDLLARARNALEARMGAEAVTAAALTAGGFSMVDRAANGIGIPIEPLALKPSADFRAALGLNDFGSARNSLQ